MSQQRIDILEKLVECVGAKIIDSELLDASFNFTLKELRAIEYVGTLTACSMTELAKRLGSPLNTLTNVVNQLVRRGLLTRSRTEQDRRVVLVKLTAEGYHVYEERRVRRRDMAAGVLAMLNESEQEQLIGLLAKLVGSVDGPWSPAVEADFE